MNVLHSEPHLALFADEDGLAIYRRIAEDAKDYLKDGGKIYLKLDTSKVKVFPNSLGNSFLKNEYERSRTSLVKIGWSWLMMDRIKQELENGRAVVLPTETVYGLFAKALDEKAVEHVYQLKRRPRDKALNLNIASLEDILNFSKNQPTYLQKLVETFLPGPLTIILEANDRVPYWVNSGLATVGFRMPSHPITLDLIREIGPLIGPSANISGQASGVTFNQILEDFDQEVLGLEDDAFLTGQDSTILDLSGDKVKILRQGAIKREDILARLPEISFEEE